MPERIEQSPIRLLDGTSWHAVVIGAGPAGAVAAAVLARRGGRVLLVEKSAWPRTKVCGGCLNQSAMQTLRNARLGRALAGGQNLDCVVWRCGRRELSVGTPAGVAILRSELDAALVSEAERLGCTFVAGVAASVLPSRGEAGSRAVQLRRGNESAAICAEMILACDGIGGTSLAAEPWATWRIARRGWIGVAATMQHGDVDVPRGAICMHIGTGGYVGLVRLASGDMHLAAALDPRKCREIGGAALLIETILRSTGNAADLGKQTTRLFGTGVMTRRRRNLGGHRILAAGDSAGYVEPFTGEGMAWAVQSAARAAEMAPAPGAAWPADLPRQWEQVHATMIGGRQRRCRWGRCVVHHPRLASATIGVASILPALGRGLAGRICGVEDQFA